MITWKPAKKMTTSVLIEILKDALSINGDQEIVIMVDGVSYPVIELNCLGEHDPLYIEGYCEL